MLARDITIAVFFFSFFLPSIFFGSICIKIIKKTESGAIRHNVMTKESSVTFKATGLRADSWPVLFAHIYTCTNRYWSGKYAPSEY